MEPTEGIGPSFPPYQGGVITTIRRGQKESTGVLPGALEEAIFTAFPTVMGGGFVTIGGKSNGPNRRCPALFLATPHDKGEHYVPTPIRRWLRGWDLNPRPSAYEADELPDCSTPL